MFDIELAVKFEAKAKADRNVSTTDDLKMEILENNEIYVEKIQLGGRKDTQSFDGDQCKRRVSFTTTQGGSWLVSEEELCFRSDDNITLFNWQKGLLLEFVNRPNYREVIWVKGVHGNKSKTSIQNYVQSLLGNGKSCAMESKELIC